MNLRRSSRGEQREADDFFVFDGNDAAMAAAVFGREFEFGGDFQFAESGGLPLREIREFP